MGAVAADTKARKKAPPSPQKIDDDDPQKTGENVAQSGLRSGAATQGPRLFFRGRASPMYEPGRRSARLTVQRHWCRPPMGAMTIENGTAIVLAYVLVSMTVIIGSYWPRSWSDGSSVGCASAAANRAEKSNPTGSGRALASGRVPPCSLISNHRGAMVMPRAVQLVFSIAAALFSW